ncbi:hypothetical protein SAMN06298216_0855 [Spirosomataceae bacterium TFI 002]|nr:hypothetical protein SAMN06298216_0855 [Spirosomataceae bacterium TFI 002]
MLLSGSKTIPTANLELTDIYFSNFMTEQIILHFACY